MIKLVYNILFAVIACLYLTVLNVSTKNLSQFEITFDPDVSNYEKISKLNNKLEFANTTKVQVLFDWIRYLRHVKDEFSVYCGNYRNKNIELNETITFGALADAKSCNELFVERKQKLIGFYIDFDVRDYKQQINGKDNAILVPESASIKFLFDWVKYIRHVTDDFVAYCGNYKLDRESMTFSQFANEGFAKLCEDQKTKTRTISIKKKTKLISFDIIFDQEISNYEQIKNRDNRIDVSETKTFRFLYDWIRDVRNVEDEFVAVCDKYELNKENVTFGEFVARGYANLCGYRINIRRKNLPKSPIHFKVRFDPYITNYEKLKLLPNKVSFVESTRVKFLFDWIKYERHVIDEFKASCGKNELISKDMTFGQLVDKCNLYQDGIFVERKTRRPALFFFNIVFGENISNYEQIKKLDNKLSVEETTSIKFLFDWIKYIRNVEDEFSVFCSKYELKNENMSFKELVAPGYAYRCEDTLNVRKKMN